MRRVSLAACALAVGLTSCTRPAPPTRAGAAGPRWTRIPDTGSDVVEIDTTAADVGRARHEVWVRTTIDGERVLVTGFGRHVRAHILMEHLGVRCRSREVATREQNATDVDGNATLHVALGEFALWERPAPDSRAEAIVAAVCAQATTAKGPPNR